MHGGLPYYKYGRFNLEELRDDECEVEFRFRKQHIYRLAAAVHLPETYKPIIAPSEMSNVFEHSLEKICSLPN